MNNLDDIVNNPSFEYLHQEDIIDLGNKNAIYYFHNYYNWDYVKDFDEDDGRRKCTCRILNFKKGHDRNIVHSYYNKCISSLNQLTGVWYMCSIPGHDQVGSSENEMNLFLDNCSLPDRFKLFKGLIKRTEVTEKKHGDAYGSRTVEKDLKSLALTGQTIKGQNIIVFDDVTTTGSSLCAAKKLLYEAGAKNVVCVAFAKTHERPLKRYY